MAIDVNAVLAKLAKDNPEMAAIQAALVKAQEEAKAAKEALASGFTITLSKSGTGLFVVKGPGLGYGANHTADSLRFTGGKACQDFVTANEAESRKQAHAWNNGGREAAKAAKAKAANEAAKAETEAKPETEAEAVNAMTDEQKAALLAQLMQS